MKGGVGKTTLTINTANYLAEVGNKVLILDLDPQFNATQSLLLRKTTKNKDVKTEEVVDEEKNQVDNPKENELIKAEADSSKYYKTLSENQKTILQIFNPTNANKDSKKDLLIKFNENLSFIPGDLELSSVIAGDTAGKISIIDSYISEYHLKRDFDYILLDCPPTWSILTHAALYASSYYVIPSKIDFYSSIGINSLQDKIKDKLTGNSMYQETSRTLTNLGIVFSMTTGLRAEAAIKETVISDYNDRMPIFDTEIPLIRSASSSFIFYSEVKYNSVYSNLTNGFEKFMKQMSERIDTHEKDESDGQ